MWASIIKRFGGWIFGAFAGIMMVLLFIRSTKKNAKSEAQSAAKVEIANTRAKDVEAIAVRASNEVKQAAETQVKTVERVNHVQNQVSSSDDDAVLRKLRDEWQRD